MIYLLSARETWPENRDCAYNFIVRAAAEPMARFLASERCGDEGPAVWLDATRTFCEVIDPEGDASVLCRDFYEG